MSTELERVEEASGFKVGDAVYIGPDLGLAHITEIKLQRDGSPLYDVAYLSRPNLETERPDFSYGAASGGYGSIFRDGFPKHVSAPRDILLLKGYAKWLEIRAARRHMEEMEKDLAALVRARKLL